jgi:hypothetical protein
MLWVAAAIMIAFVALGQLFRIEASWMNTPHIPATAAEAIDMPVPAP